MYYYKNIETGEITDDLWDARGWYKNNGESVEMYRYSDHKLVAVWRHS